MSEQPIQYWVWINRLKYALVAAGVFPIPNYIFQIQVNEEAWRHFYDDGFLPIEAVIEDLNNQS